MANTNAPLTPPTGPPVTTLVICSPPDSTNVLVTVAIVVAPAVIGAVTTAAGIGAQLKLVGGVGKVASSVTVHTAPAGTLIGEANERVVWFVSVIV